MGDIVSAVDGHVVHAGKQLASLLKPDRSIYVFVILRLIANSPASPASPASSALPASPAAYP